MNDEFDTGAPAAALQTLLQLDEQAELLRAELKRLRQELAEVQRDIDGSHAAQLLEANEQLVLAALRAETIAETAVNNLGELARTAQRDALTDTPSRALMLDRLQSAIAMARRHKTNIAVLFVDLDHFKSINDTLGHAVGDAVLQRVARRLESVVRHSDTVSRHGGDEFLVLLTELSKPDDAGRIAAKILSALAEPSRVGDQVLRLSASVGIAVYPQDGDDAELLVSRADTAMYRSKRRGQGGFEFYDPRLASDISPAHCAIGAARQAASQPELVPAAPDLHVRNLREANEQLVFAALSAQASTAAAEEAQRRQIRFLAMVAHELRNPLTPIRTAAELLNRAGADESQLARLQAVIKRQVAHMARLVDDLLDGSRVSEGKFRIERSSVELIGILHTAIETCRPAIEKRLQHLKLELPPGPLSLCGDPVRLAQIFTNLLDNASKYTQKGGELALTLELHDRAAMITVADNGIGIAADALTGIFGLFVQDPRALAVHDGGLGIGLAVVRDLVEAHGGGIVASSAGRGLGSEFVVTLPGLDEATEPGVVASAS